MAVVLLDTCVIVDLARPESEWFEWSASTLEQLDNENVFTINPVIYAEAAMGFDSIEEVEALLAYLQLQIEELPREVLFLAGKAFLKYRKRAGKKSRAC